MNTTRKTNAYGHPLLTRGVAQCSQQQSQTTDKVAQQSETESVEQTQRSETPSSTSESQSDDSSTGDDDSEGEPEEDAEYTLPLDQTFEILKNSRRRETLRYLREHDGNATLSDVAEHIAALENDTTVHAITSTQRKRVYVGLYQCHLPKMDDTDVIEFNQNRGTIRIGPNADQLYPYLEEPSATEWHKLYLSVAVVGVGLFAASQVGGTSYGLTATVVLIVLLLAMVTVVGIHSFKASSLFES